MYNFFVLQDKKLQVKIAFCQTPDMLGDLLNPYRQRRL